MENSNPTFILMDELIGIYGLSEEFLWSIVGPGASVIYSADIGYIEFLGESLIRLQRIHEACKVLAKGKLSISVAAFLQEQALVQDTPDGLDIRRTGDYIADGLLSASDSLIIAKDSFRAELDESKALLPQNSSPWAPGKYQPFLRAM